MPHMLENRRGRPFSLNHNLLLVAQELGQGGTERQLAATALSMHASGCFEPHVGTLRPDGFRLQEIRAAGIPTVCFPLASFRNPASVLRTGWRLRRHVTENAVKLVHSFDAPGNVIAAPAASGVARVITSQRGHRDLSPTWMRPLLRLTDRLAHLVVVNCLAMGEHLEEEGVDARKIRLCYNGLDLDQFHARGRSRPEPLRDAVVTVGVVCALRPEKDLLTLVDAFVRTWRLRPELRLVVVGSGPERDGLERALQAAGARDAAHLEPAVADVAPWLRGIDIFVLPSRSEAMSNALMEAMACGCAAVASSAGGNPELVRDGESGLLFPPGDAEALAGLLLRLASDADTRHRLAAAAHRRVETEFSLEAAARRMTEIYTEALA